MSFIDELFSLKGKVVLVTGAASGLGQHSTQTLAKAGARVAITDIDKNGLKETEKKITALGGDVLSLPADISDAHQVQSVVDEVTRAFGQIDVLFNFAALIHYRPLLEIEEKDWISTFHVDLLGTWYMGKAVVKQMIEKKIEGSIINISSSLSYRTQVNTISYSTLKASTNHLTRSMGLELAKYKIRVNAIAPGFVNTNMVKEFLATENGKAALKTIPFKRAADVSELDGILLLLASDASSYISGAVFKVDGGFAFNSIEF